MSKKLVKKLFLLGLVFLFIFPFQSLAANHAPHSNGKSDTINNIKGKDVGNNGNGSDLEVHFNVAKDKGKYDQYRIFVAKASKAGEFDLEAANKNKNYTVAPNGKNIKTTLSSTAKDTDGALITNDVSYTIFVLSVKGDEKGKGNGNGKGKGKEKAKGNVLSKAKKDITLSGYEESILSVTDVRTADVGNFNDGRDLHISFTKLADEKNLEHYRVFVVKSDKAKNFQLANAIENKHYTTIAKTGANIAQTLGSSARDTDGQLIGNNVNYQVFVMSVGKTGFGSALSLPSTTFMLLNGTADLKVTNVLAKDVADFGDGRDLQVEFTIPRDETNVREYRVMVVPTVHANNFSLTTALQVSPSNYTTVKKAGANLVTTLASTANDVYGARIVNNTSYHVFVLTVGQHHTHELSNHSLPITLYYNFTTPAVTNLAVSDVNNHGDGRDLQVSFTKVADESTVAEYRIFVVRNSEATSFDLAKANAVASGNYTTFAKKGTNISQVLAHNAKDTGGRKIERDVNYRVFVMSVSSVGTENALTGASQQINLN
ncbi:hypothetical protein DS745_22695 [Anaerobacillus alkaliphilus]|uniref:Uncharacterized protein n=1 Tax=Anaerobacillus alkaliphilus TaxID=1548597 RepID=A0A4Q0VNS4_9BACI|nr:hypothetical protein [Anaerobacillus alkaliphilus]RXI96520.1 hypothetical protein DS745_22695 [Anaerobacillus alkaliphilus]